MDEITERPTTQPKENRGAVKERQVKAWSEKLKEERKTPEQVVGELIAGGAHVGNYASSPEGEWKPEVYASGSGRKMIGFSVGSHIGVGVRLGVKTLKEGLEYVKEIRGSSSLKANKLFMVPYPKFSGESEEVDPKKSFVFLLHE